MSLKLLTAFCSIEGCSESKIYASLYVSKDNLKKKEKEKSILVNCELFGIDLFPKLFCLCLSLCLGCLSVVSVDNLIERKAQLIKKKTLSSLKDYSVFKQEMVIPNNFYKNKDKLFLVS